MDLPYKLEITTVQRHPTHKPINFSSFITPLCMLQSKSHLKYFLMHLPFFNDLSLNTDINIFKYPIKPLWEDEQNLSGGKYIIKIKRHLGQRMFERLLVYFALGELKSEESAENGSTVIDNVNGIVGSIRGKQVILSVWTKDGRNIVDVLRKIFGEDVVIEFKDNDESLKDNSSFRNTSVFSGGNKNNNSESKYGDSKYGDSKYGDRNGNKKRFFKGSYKKKE